MTVAGPPTDPPRPMDLDLLLERVEVGTEWAVDRAVDDEVRDALALAHISASAASPIELRAESPGRAPYVERLSGPLVYLAGYLWLAERAGPVDDRVAHEIRQLRQILGGLDPRSTGGRTA